MEEPNREDCIFEEHPELVGNPKEYDNDKFEEDCNKYQTALSKVIFEGWEVKWISEDKDDVALYNAEKSLTAQFRLWRNNEVEFDYKIITTLSDLTKFNLKLK